MKHQEVGCNSLQVAVNKRHVLPSLEIVAQTLPRVLERIDVPEPVIPAMSKDEHMAEALEKAKNVKYQFTAQAKKAAKRECLAHLIASLKGARQ